MIGEVQSGLSNGLRMSFDVLRCTSMLIEIFRVLDGALDPLGDASKHGEEAWREHLEGYKS